MNTNTPFLYQIYKPLFKFILIILFIMGINFVLMPMAHRVSAAEKSYLSKYAETGDEKFDKIFREGRDLIDKEEWANAVAKFNQIACDCPEKKYVDAAFYWLAFSYKKQKMYKEMDETIVRLIKNFPDSSWADDARVLQLTVSPVNRATMPRTIYNQSSAGSLSTNIYFPAGELTGISTTSSSPTPLDREDEIKLAAFQSLHAADTKRGIEVLGDILKTDSKASETLKRAVLRSLGNRTFSLSSYPSGFYETKVTPDKNQFIPLLRETLVKSYQNDSNVKIRTEIIYVLANMNDDQSFNYIVQLYASESNKELKKAIINSFSGSFYTFSSYSNLAATVSDQAPVVSGQGATGSNSNANSAKNIRFDKLMEIVRTEKDIELKRLAFSNVQRVIGWSGKDGMIETISGLYDAETDEQFKISIIRSFAGSKQNQAMMKLLSIAKTDKSDKLRLEAIRSLGTSKDPEVLKFLEDLIK